LEVGSGEPPKAGETQRIEAAFEELLFHGRSDLAHPLQGPLAELLKSEPEIRDELSANVGSQKKIVWAQASAEGELRQMVFFDGDHPARIFFYHSGSKVSQVLYDIRFPQKGSAPEVKIYGYDRETQAFHSPILLSPDRSASTYPYDSQVTLHPDGNRFSIYRTELQFVPTGNRMAVEVRDWEGNYLLSLSPQAIIGSPGERLLAMMNLSNGSNGSPILRAEAKKQTGQLIRELAAKNPGDPERQAAVNLLGHTPDSLIQKLVDMSLETESTPVRQLLDEIQATREIEGYHGRHKMISYRPLEDMFSLVHFVETLSDGRKLDRNMVRIFWGPKQNLTDLLLKGLTYLGDNRHHEGSRDDMPLGDVIQVIARESTVREDPEGHDMFRKIQIRAAVEEMDAAHVRLKRITFIQQNPREYPRYQTYRPAKDASGKRTGPFEEDLRFRDVHPMLAHLIELGRWSQFRITRDIAHSNRMVHVYHAKSKVELGRKPATDYRVTAQALVPRIDIERDPQGRLVDIPKLRTRFEKSMDSLEASLTDLDKKDPKPRWNRIFVNVQPVLAAKPKEIEQYLGHLLDSSMGRLQNLDIDKVVFKIRVRDILAPDKFHTALVRFHNPSGLGFEARYDYLIQAKTSIQSEELSQVLVREEVYKLWREGPERVSIGKGFMKPADSTIRPLDAMGKRMQDGQRKGLWAYHYPSLIRRVGGEFWEQLHKGQSVSLAEQEGRKYPTVFTELTLDPKTPISEATGQVDYHQARLIPAKGSDGQAREAGKNVTGLAIWVAEEDIGIGIPVKRVVMVGDLTHPSKGAMDPKMAASILGAYRLAEEWGVPVDWYTDTFGAGIKNGGVENLEASAATQRELVKQNHPAGVPTNIVTKGVTIGIG
ncbi:MAG: hypothetical protein R3257_04420, partial [bacterium]|nr:hypothetical protein [bacterium]